MKTHLVGKRSVDSGDSVGIELSPVGVGEVDLRRSKSGSSNEVEGGVSETRREENEDATGEKEFSDHHLQLVVLQDSLWSRMPICELEGIEGRKKREERKTHPTSFLASHRKGFSKL